MSFLKRSCVNEIKGMAATRIIEGLFNTPKHLHFSLCNRYSRINTVPEWFISSLAFVLSGARLKAKRHHKQIHIICVPYGATGSPLLGCELFWAGVAMVVSALWSCPPLCAAWSWWDTLLPTLTPLSLGGGMGAFLFAFGFGGRVQPGWASKPGSPGTLLSTLVRCRCVHWRWQLQEG